MNGLAAVLFSLPGVLGAESGGASFWFPQEASQAARQVDSIFYFVYAVSLFFFVLIVGLMIFMVVRYHKRPGREVQPSPDHSNALELTWSLIPIGLVLVMFYLGFTRYLDMRTPPDDAMEIQVTARKWFWTFTYPNGYESTRIDDEHPGELHVPPGEPVRLVLRSDDVIHGFFIPAFRLKMDVVPGRYNKAWFTATEPGTYQILCSSYCGMGHSEMRAWCIVHKTRAEFLAWLEKAQESAGKALTPVERGRRVYLGKGGCSQCHSLEERTIVGPTFKNLYGSPVAIGTGKIVTADENYLRESILDPGAKIVAGFQNVMPIQRGRLTEREIDDVI